MTSRSATWPSGTASRWQVLRDGFDSRLEPIAFDIYTGRLLTRRAQAHFAVSLNYCWIFSLIWLAEPKSLEIDGCQRTISNREKLITHWKSWFHSGVRHDWSPTIFQNLSPSPARAQHDRKARARLTTPLQQLRVQNSGLLFFKVYSTVSSFSPHFQNWVRFRRLWKKALWLALQYIYKWHLYLL